jgi:hypothetical protein
MPEQNEAKTPTNIRLRTNCIIAVSLTFPHNPNQRRKIKNVPARERLQCIILSKSTGRTEARAIMPFEHT